MEMHQSLCYSNILNCRNLNCLAWDYSTLGFLAEILCLKYSDPLHWQCYCCRYLASGVYTLSWPRRCLTSWKCCCSIYHLVTRQANSLSKTANVFTHLYCCVATCFYFLHLCLSYPVIQPCCFNYYFCWCSFIQHFSHHFSYYS